MIRRRSDGILFARVVGVFECARFCFAIMKVAPTPKNLVFTPREFSVPPYPPTCAAETGKKVPEKRGSKVPFIRSTQRSEGENSSTTSAEIEGPTGTYGDIVYNFGDACRIPPGLSSICYFPIEFQGTFLTQTQASAAYGGHTVTYSEITVEVDSIPPWGRCHRRRGNNVILKDSTGGAIPMKKLPGRHAQTRAVLERRFKEILLFRKHEPGTMMTVEDLFCPISGRFRFTYTANHGEFQCEQPFSELSNCPNGNGLNVRFRQCAFPDMSISFLCLGDWAGLNGDRYIALMDLRDEPQARPKYRCGLYRKDKTTGRVFVSLASDSTCINQLTSATVGYESLVLNPLPDRSLPAQVEAAHCRFPEWSQGPVGAPGGERQLFPVQGPHSVPRHHGTVHPAGEHHAERQVHCLHPVKKAIIVSGCKESAKRYGISIRRKVAQNPSGRLPNHGRLHGEVPGTHGLCAKVSSDCNNPDIMFYTVSNCEERGHVYEEREYRCLGSWEEDGILFTYTQRRDMDGFQCFSGKVLRNGEEAFIKEAGDSCIRGEDPLIYGMKILKQSSCPQLAPANFVPMRPPWKPMTYPPPPLPTGIPKLPIRPSPSRDPYWYHTATEQPTTKPWKPITGRPRPDPSSASSRLYHSYILPSALCILLLVFAFFPSMIHFRCARSPKI
ncbi:uncharacterized protein CEXT_619671 [Caerostris extrusa]|uniref:Uncharacterized protein n=1 Tax=Caerostris extrusa TaxID=172846 RepID=A0AAV4W8E7_CAEEX|nr:uncharacterized protein CEXT_619671 [Caerostris extrusa]